MDEWTAWVIYSWTGVCIRLLSYVLTYALTSRRTCWLWYESTYLLTYWHMYLQRYLFLDLRTYRLTYLLTCSFTGPKTQGKTSAENHKLLAPHLRKVKCSEWLRTYTRHRENHQLPFAKLRKVNCTDSLRHYTRDRENHEIPMGKQRKNKPQQCAKTKAPSAKHTARSKTTGGKKPKN